MSEYIGVKLVEAQPEERDGKPGYTVKYPDGYTSWCPKDVFESAYYDMDSNSSLGNMREYFEKALGGPLFNFADSWMFVYKWAKQGLTKTE